MTNPRHRPPGRPMVATGPLADALRQRGWTRDELASHAGISRSTVAALLAGGRPKYETAVKVARALRSTVERLWPVS